MKVLLVEDHPTVRLGVRTVLELEGAEIVGETEVGHEALRMAYTLEPDLVILDLRLRAEDSGIELCREIKSLPDPPQVVIHTAYNSPKTVYSCRLAGADGYVHKSEDATKLAQVVQRAEDEKTNWSLGLELETPVAVQNGDPRSGREELTRKEQEVYALLLKRRTNPEIARELGLSAATVKTHVARILRKLGIKSRRHLA